MNFNDEVTAALRVADGVLLVVDAVEGVMMGTDRALRQARPPDRRDNVLTLRLELMHYPEARRASACCVCGRVGQGALMPAAEDT